MSANAEGCVRRMKAAASEALILLWPQPAASRPSAGRSSRTGRQNLTQPFIGIRRGPLKLQDESGCATPEPTRERHVAPRPDRPGRGAEILRGQAAQFFGIEPLDADTGT